MIKASETWKLVEEKLAELQGLVDENWDNGEWQLALKGESVIKAVKKCQNQANELREQTNEFLRKVRSMQPDNRP